MELNDTIEQLRGMVGFVSMCRNADKYTREERHGFLTFAIMHACQAAIFGNMDGGRGAGRWGMTIHDYKHVLIKAADAVMNGQSIDEVMKNVEDYSLAKTIDWNYFSEKKSQSS